jgi:ABC-type phosphate transport system ATPase subunit
VDEFAVKTLTLETPLRSLSGGNIQKLILVRELSGTPVVLVASQPTRRSKSVPPSTSTSGWSSSVRRTRPSW